MDNRTLDIPAELQKEIVDSSSEMVKNIAINFFIKLKPFLYILIALVLLYILYKIIRFFLAWKKAKREKLTYQNTEKILEKIDNLERKIDSLIKKPKQETAKREKKVEGKKLKKSK